jgi:serine/threonine protein kinase
VHRDINPENIMIRPDGLVKILDFGIAKLTENKTETSNNAATTIKVETAAGMIIGTAAYMSPEQAQGKEVDARPDYYFSQKGPLLRRFYLNLIVLIE